MTLAFTTFVVITVSIFKIILTTKRCVFYDFKHSAPTKTHVPLNCFVASQSYQAMTCLFSAAYNIWEKSCSNRYFFFQTIKLQIINKMWRIDTK